MHKSKNFENQYWPGNKVDKCTYMYIIVSLGSNYSKLLKHDPGMERVPSEGRGRFFEKYLFLNETFF